METILCNGVNLPEPNGHLCRLLDVTTEDIRSTVTVYCRVGRGNTTKHLYCSCSARSNHSPTPDHFVPDAANVTVPGSRSLRLSHSTARVTLLLRDPPSISLVLASVSPSLSRSLLIALRASACTSPGVKYLFPPTNARINPRRPFPFLFLGTLTSSTTSIHRRLYVDRLSF
ncbi:Uncharacterized protein HZ326_6749 [Fusarium oxysporum f. sp. albedinis]|nr:Uncharacterized protein HZ326_6749 [Fusarium oxysporum f. sp. albedinis]